MYVVYFTAHNRKTNGCCTVLVFEDNQKNNQPVCAAEEAGYVEYAGLPGKVKTGKYFLSTAQLRQMKQEQTKSHRQGAPFDGVVEAIPKKKKTRSGTHYEVFNPAIIHI